MDFGLGLVLSFTNNATSGINSAVSSLSHLTQVAENASNSLNSLSDTASLSALSVIADQVGNSFERAGLTIISTFSEAINKVKEVGIELSYAESMLSKLYENSGKTGKDVVNQISEYAKSSIFNFKDLIPAVRMLKANGIEAFDKITLSMSGTQTTLMDLAADLAVFNPQMRNMYGEGVMAAMGAFNEYIAEGSVTSLRRGASLDILTLLGEEKGKNIEERTAQIARLMEQLNMVGMVEKLADTPMQRISNMGDVLFITLSKISDSGVMEEFTRIIEKISDYVFDIPDEELDSIAKTIGSALVMIMKPLKLVINIIIGFADAMRYLVANNPFLAKLIIILTAVSGAMLVAVGVALKVVSSMAGLVIVFKELSDTTSKFAQVFSVGMNRVRMAILPVTLALGLAYIAWRTNFAGLRTLTENLVSNFSRSWQNARNAVNGSVSGIKDILQSFDNRNDFFSNLTLGLMRLMMVFKAVSEAWNDFTLSEETFNKMNELGVRPLVEAILDFKYRFGLFVEGFKAGWSEVMNIIITVVKGIGASIKGTPLESFFTNIGNFLKKLSSGDAQAWYDFGNSFAKFSAVVLLAVGSFKAFGTVVSIVSSIGLSFVQLVQTVRTVATVIATLGNGIFNLFARVATFFKSNPIVLAVIGIATAVLNFFDMLNNGFSWVKEAFMLLGIALATIGLIIASPFLAAHAVIVGIIAGIVALVATAVILIKDNWNSIVSFFSNVWNTIATTASTVIGWIVTHFNTAVTNIKGFFSALPTFFQGLWSSIVSIFTTIGSAVGNAVSGAVKGAVNKVLSTAQRIINGFISSINSAIGIINAIPGVSISKLNPISLPQLATGGVVDKPTQAIIGEAGAEAVVPLENNTEWIAGLAGKIGDYIINDSRLRPNSTIVSADSTRPNSTENRYMTSNTSSAMNDYSQDNSVTFSQGSIVIYSNGTSDSEAERMAEKIMQYIKRKQELSNMLSYR